MLRRKSRHLTRLGIKVPDVTNTLQLPSEATCRTSPSLLSDVPIVCTRPCKSFSCILFALSHSSSSCLPSKTNKERELLPYQYSTCNHIASQNNPARDAFTACINNSGLSKHLAHVRWQIEQLLSDCLQWVTFRLVLWNPQLLAKGP